jgi:putative ABC transport system permease protein
MPALRNIRYSLRQLRLNPGFALAAIGSLALGAGANTAIFQLLDTIRLRTLPIRAPQELVELRIDDMTHARGNTLRDNSLTNPLWEQIRAHQELFAGVFAWADETFNIAPTGQRQDAAGLWVSGDLFRTLGVQPILGRVFSAADDQRGCGLGPGAVISHGFWQRQFAGDPAIIGRNFSLGDQSIPVIGVTPPEFFGLEVGRTFDIALPICSQPSWQRENRLNLGTTWWLSIMARLKPGASRQQLATQLRTVSPRIFEASLPADFPRESVKPYLNMKLYATPAGGGVSRLREQYTTPLALLLAIAGLVLLIACANLANLMLARSSARQREMAVRLAVGASRLELVQQLMTEGLLLALTGAAAGLLLAQTLSRFLVSLLTTANDPSFLDLRPDWRVFAFSTGIAVVTCVLFALAPALRAARTDPGDALRSGSRNTAGPERFSLRRILVASQIALSLVLLTGALLFVGTLRNLLVVHPGFDPQGVLITDINFKSAHLPAGRVQEFRREITDRVRAIPGVQWAAQATLLPLSGSNWNNRMWMDDSDFAHARVSYRSMVGPGYFRTLKTPVLAGREFNERDIDSGPIVAIVNEAFARQFTGGRNPVGRRFRIETTPYQPESSYEIVGLVKDAKYHDLREDAPPVMYIPIVPKMLGADVVRIMVRSTERPEGLVAAMRTTLGQISPEMSYSFRFFDTWIQASLLSERLMATLAAIFGALAIALTAIGLYGVISYTVARRTSEIGVRIALGANHRAVMTLILGEAAVVLAAGLALGTILSLATARAATTLLFGLKPYDPLTLVVAAVAIAIITVGAGYLPARRAAALNPVTALRQE